MKNIVYSVLVIIILVLGILGWQQYKQDTEFAKSLLLHQPIDRNQVAAIHLWEKGNDIKLVPADDYSDVVEWFNHYPANKVSEEKIPTSTAQVIIDLTTNNTIVINYLDGRIYVARNDVGVGVEYVFLDPAPKLEQFFKDFLKMR